MNYAIRSIRPNLPHRNRMMALFVTCGLLAFIAWGALSYAPPIAKILPFQDKIEHFGAFAALTLWLALSFGRQRKLMIGALAIGAAMALEMAQAGLTATRTASLPDLIASSLGVVAALTFILVAERLIRRRA